MYKVKYVFDEVLVFEENSSLPFIPFKGQFIHANLLDEWSSFWVIDQVIISLNEKNNFDYFEVVLSNDGGNS